MNHKATRKFWTSFDALSDEDQRAARASFRLMKANPNHPSLHAKKVGRYYSARFSDSHRAVAIVSGNQALWFWIGPHDEYERLIRA